MRFALKLGYKPKQDKTVPPLPNSNPTKLKPQKGLQDAPARPHLPHADLGTGLRGDLPAQGAKHRGPFWRERVRAPTSRPVWAPPRAQTWAPSSEAGPAAVRDSGRPQTHPCRRPRETEARGRRRLGGSNSPLQRPRRGAQKVPCHRPRHAQPRGAGARSPGPAAGPPTPRGLAPLRGPVRG